jgi:homoserine dehydrogenase
MLSERPCILETSKNTKESEVVERRWPSMGIEIINLKHINPTPIFVFKLRLIVLGFGVVGQSFAKLLLSRSADIYNMYGIKPRIVACVDSKGASISSTGLDLKRLLDVKKSRGSIEEYDNKSSRLDSQSIIENVDAEVLLELTPTNLEEGEPGTTHIISAMKSGKHVITVNKGPLALAFPSLLELANYNGVMLRFSGTVGGGTPILDFAKRCLKGERIMSFKGILNGTTNYILSKMEEGLTFQSALDYAKQKGYAEALPALDIDGYDAAAKLVIMANWIMGMKVTMKDINRIGIREIKLADMRSARKRGNAIKLIAMCENKYLEVKPMEVSKLDPLCVNGTLNAVTFSSQHSGQQTIIGRGAGGMETASAILRDIIEIKDIGFGTRQLPA